MSDHTCPTCEGTGTSGFDRNQSHTEGRYVEYPCQECGGSGLNPAVISVGDLESILDQVLPPFGTRFKAPILAAVAAFLAYGKGKP